MNKPLIVLGAGGHASVLVDMLRSQGVVPIALVAPAAGTLRAALADIPFWHDEKILTYHPDKVVLVNGIGSLPGNPLRATLFARYRALGYRFASVVSAQAMVSDYAVLEEGAQVMAGAIIQAGTQIGANSIINSGAIVDHDCRLGDDNHIAPGAVLSGGVVTGERVHIGTGAAVIQNIKIGSHTVVGAGATVVKDLANNQVLYVAKSFLR
ncbi:acetyltransferase [Aeromonas veronii]|uniref:Shikimate dehydrogenase n=1 Tax=Aeromonas veronii TaxID=654 RepID=A0ABY3MHC2_AERVE|nr:acetyltransferase [Aeromonas veronii]RDU79756.1 shikimate dehydrogenase [Aeromonas veronii]RDU80076.1 shikimate dehydrogenase [Aeromonas veronii]RDU86146.1 shikimate dehydrogenase [Aeromonas veronii]RDU94330.1 shikimate dehydrogenase [Aeromonas veronii]TEY45995.1 shikimate dehydrogenase [Aeromonas veronii]